MRVTYATRKNGQSHHVRLIAPWLECPTGIWEANTEIDLSSNQTVGYMFVENCSVVDLFPLQKCRLDILLVNQKLL